MSETTKAAAWAVFQHHGGSVNYNRSYRLAVRSPTRFKIEAQMKNAGRSKGHHGVATVCTTTANNNQWDAGSTLFDSYELDSLSKQFDQAFLLPSRSSREEEPHARLASIDETHPVDTTRMTSPFSRQQSYHDARRVLLPSQWIRDCAEDAYTMEHRRLQPMRPDSIDENTVYRRDEPADGQSADKSSGMSYTQSKSPVEEIEETLKVRQDDSSFQFAHTPNPLNLSQRKSRRSMDKSQDPDGRRKSFQEKLRSFFHKARISPQDSTHKDSNRRGRKSYTAGPEDSLSHYGWSYVDDDHSHIPEELSYESRHRRRLIAFIRKVRAHKKRAEAEPPAAVATSLDCHKLSKLTKSERSFSLRSIGKALQSLPHHFGPSELHNRQQQQQKSTVIEHEHHHVYHHHHVVIQQQQQQQQKQAEDYELTLQDIDRRVLRKSFEEKARRISMEDHGSHFKVPRNSLEEIREHQTSFDIDMEHLPQHQQQKKQQSMISY